MLLKMCKKMDETRFYPAGKNRKTMQRTMAESFELNREPTTLEEDHILSFATRAAWKLVVKDRRKPTGTKRHLCEESMDG